MRVQGRFPNIPRHHKVQSIINSSQEQSTTQQISNDMNENDLIQLRKQLMKRPQFDDISLPKLIKLQQHLNQYISNSITNTNYSEARKAMSLSNAVDSEINKCSKMLPDTNQLIQTSSLNNNNKDAPNSSIVTKSNGTVHRSALIVPPSKAGLSNLSPHKSGNKNYNKMHQQRTQLTPGFDSITKSSMINLEDDPLIKEFNAETKAKFKQLNYKHQNQLEDFENRWEAKLKTKYMRHSQEYYQLNRKENELRMNGDEEAANSIEAEKIRLENEEYELNQNKFYTDYTKAKQNLFDSFSRENKELKRKRHALKTKMEQRSHGIQTGPIQRQPVPKLDSKAGFTQHFQKTKYSNQGLDMPVIAKPHINNVNAINNDNSSVLRPKTVSPKSHSSLAYKKSVIHATHKNKPNSYKPSNLNHSIKREKIKQSTSDVDTNPINSGNALDSTNNENNDKLEKENCENKSHIMNESAANQGNSIEVNEYNGQSNKEKVELIDRVKYERKNADSDPEQTKSNELNEDLFSKVMQSITMPLGFKFEVPSKNVLLDPKQVDFTQDADATKDENGYEPTLNTLLHMNLIEKDFVDQVNTQIVITNEEEEEYFEEDSKNDHFDYDNQSEKSDQEKLEKEKSESDEKESQSENDDDQIERSDQEKLEKGKSESEKEKSESEKEKSDSEKDKSESGKDKSESEKDKSESEKDKLESEKDKSESEKDKSESEKDKSENEKDKSESEKDKSESEKDKSKSEKDKSESEKDKSENEEDKSESEKDKSESEEDKSENEEDKSENEEDKSESEKDKSESEKDKSESEKDKSESEKDKSESEKDKSDSEKERAYNEKEKAESEKEKSESEKDKSESEKDKSESEKDKSESEKDKSESEKDKSESEKDKSENEKNKSENGKDKSENEKEKSESDEKESESENDDDQSGRPYDQEKLEKVKSDTEENNKQSNKPDQEKFEEKNSESKQTRTDAEENNEGNTENNALSAINEFKEDDKLQETQQEEEQPQKMSSILAALLEPPDISYFPVPVSASMVNRNVKKAPQLNSLSASMVGNIKQYLVSEESSGFTSNNSTESTSRKTSLNSINLKSQILINSDYPSLKQDNQNDDIPESNNTTNNTPILNSNLAEVNEGNQNENSNENNSESKLESKIERDFLISTMPTTTPAMSELINNTEGLPRATSMSHVKDEIHAAQINRAFNKNEIPQTHVHSTSQSQSSKTTESDIEEKDEMLLPVNDSDDNVIVHCEPIRVENEIDLMMKSHQTYEEEEEEEEEERFESNENVAEENTGNQKEK